MFVSLVTFVAGVWVWATAVALLVLTLVVVVQAVAARVSTPASRSSTRPVAQGPRPAAARVPELAA